MGMKPMSHAQAVIHRNNGVPQPPTATIPPSQTEALERVITALEYQLKISGQAMTELKTQLTTQAAQLNRQSLALIRLSETMLETQTAVSNMHTHQRKLQDYQHNLFINSNLLQHSLAIATKVLKTKGSVFDDLPDVAFPPSYHTEDDPIMQMPSTDSDKTAYGQEPTEEMNEEDDETIGQLSRTNPGYKPPIYYPEIDDDDYEETADDMSQSVKSDHTMQSVLEDETKAKHTNEYGNEVGLSHIEEHGPSDDESRGGRSDAATAV